MSASTAPTDGSSARVPLTRPARVTATAGTATAGGGAPSLRLVPRRRSKAARAPFVIVVVLLLGGGLLGLLALNTLLAQDAFTLHSLQKKNTELAERQQVLQREVDAREEPAALAAKATALGMQPGEFAAFIDMQTGRILGNVTGEKADIPVVPKPAAKPTEPAATPAGTPTSATSGATGRATATPGTTGTRKATATPGTTTAATPGAATATGTTSTATSGAGR